MKKSTSFIIILAFLLIAGVIWYFSNSSDSDTVINEDVIEKVTNEDLKESLLEVQKEGAVQDDSTVVSEVEKKSISKRHQIIRKESEASTWAQFTTSEIKENLSDSLEAIRTDCDKAKFNRLIKQCDSDIALGQFFERNEEFRVEFNQGLVRLRGNCNWH